jgi:hypothetical protein
MAWGRHVSNEHSRCARACRCSWAWPRLPLALKLAHIITELLDQQLEALEWEATSKGGIQAVLEQHFAKLYRVRVGTAA